MASRLFFFYSFILFILFLALFFRPITAINDDLGRHILLGEIILKTQEVPDVNLLSYTYTNYPFINSSWLSGVLFFVSYKIGGFNLLQILSLGVVFFACFLQLKFVARRFSFLLVIGIATLYLFLLIPRTDIRPEIFSMLMISIFITTLYEFLENRTKKIYLLIPLEVLWVNLHIYFFVGPLLVGLFFLANFFVKKKTQTKLKNLFQVFLGVIIATIVNPNGVTGALFPFLVFKNYGFPVTENQSVLTLFRVFNTNSALLPVFIIIFIFALSFFSRKKMTLVDWMIFAVFSILSLVNFRNITLLVFATFIPSVRLMSNVLEKYSSIISFLPRKALLLMYPLFLFILLILIVKTITVHGFGFGVADYGKRGVDFFLKNKIHGPSYNDFNIGGYLSYRIYPGLVFVDNRPEAYPKEFFKNIYLPLQNDHMLFEKLDKKYKFNAVIVSHWDSSPFENKLLQYFVTTPTFVLVYLDDYSMVLVKDSEENKKIIDKHKITKNNLRFEDINDTTVLIHYLFLFEKIKWEDKVQEVMMRLKVFDPQLCILSNYPLSKKSNLSFSEDGRYCGQFK